MEIDVKHFLIVNGFILGAIILSIYRRNRNLSAGPTRLNMKVGENLSNTPSFAGELSAIRNQSGPRMLNLYFEHEGKTWDAYEVLGLPAGCSRDLAEKTYLSLKPSEEQRVLFDLAYREIMLSSS